MQVKNFYMFLGMVYSANSFLAEILNKRHEGSGIYSKLCRAVWGESEENITNKDRARKKTLGNGSPANPL